MSHEEFSTLNPSFNRPVIVASHNHSMLLPTDKLDQFIENLVAYRTSGKPLSSWTTYRVKPEDTVASIARKAHMTETALREANQIPVGRRIKPGSLVLVSKASGLGNAEDISSDTIDASFALAQDYRRVTYRVRRGDNMRSVARRLGVSPATIMKSNGLRSQRLRVGQTLRVNVPIVTRQTTSSRPSTARSTPNTPVASTKFYVVRKGDTLYSIANRYGISASALRNANNISGNNISVGQRLTINASGTPTKRHVVLEEVPAKLQKQVNKRPLANKATYKVRKGDTLFSIASSANMSVNRKEIKRYPQQQSKSRTNIKTGTVIFAAIHSGAGFTCSALFLCRYSSDLRLSNFVFLFTSPDLFSVIRPEFGKICSFNLKVA